MSFEDGLDSYKMPTNWKTTDHLNLGPSSSPPRSSFWLASIDLRVNRNLWVIYCPLHNPHGLLLVKTVVHVMVIRNSLWGIRMRDYSQFHMVKCWDTIFVDRWWKKQRSLSWQPVWMIWMWNRILEVFPKLFVYRLWQHGDFYSPGLCLCHLSFVRRHWLVSQWNDFPCLGPWYFYHSLQVGGKHIPAAKVLQICLGSQASKGFFCNSELLRFCLFVSVPYVFSVTWNLPQKLK